MKKYKAVYRNYIRHCSWFTGERHHKKRLGDSPTSFLKTFSQLELAFFLRHGL